MNDINSQIVNYHTLIMNYWLIETDLPNQSAKTRFQIVEMVLFLFNSDYRSGTNSLKLIVKENLLPYGKNKTRPKRAIHRESNREKMSANLSLIPTYFRAPASSSLQSMICSRLLHVVGCIGMWMPVVNGRFVLVRSGPNYS